MLAPAPPLKNTSLARIVSRLRALAHLGFAPELTVPEMCILMARGLRTTTQPAVFVIGAEAAVTRPQDFIVWLGADQMVRELRQLLTMGIWPGPKDTPSLKTIMTRRENRRVFAATLWGEGCTDEGPWGDLWRARGIQHGLQAVFFAPSGLTAVAVMSRASGEPPFSARAIAFAEACVPVIAGAIDGAALSEACDTPLPEAQLVLDAAGKAGPMSFGVAELLRDMGGGTDGAGEAMVVRIEAIAASLDQGARLAADPFLHLRRMGKPAPGAARPLQDIAIAHNAFGRFTARFSPLAGGDRSAGTIATIRRHVPRALLAARGALSAGASAREMELAVALARRSTLEAAAAEFGVGLSSIKTLLDRLTVRLGAANRAAALSALTKLGRAASW